MATTLSNFGAAVAAEIPLFFRDTFDALVQGEGAYLRDGEPQSATSRIGQQVGRAACRLYARDPSFVNGVPQTRFEKGCRPYLDSISPRDGGGPSLPYRGGQCPTTYLVFATLDGVDLNVGGQTPRPILGPLGNPLFTTTTIGSPFPDSTRYRWVFPNDPGSVLQFTARASFVQNPDFRVAGRIDGQEDSCGNVPPVIVPPQPLPDPQPPPFRFNPTPNIDIDIDVDIFPDGTISFDFGTGPITVDPFADPVGDDDGANGGPPPGDVGEPGAPEETGDGGSAGGCAPEEQVLTGLKIDILEVPPWATEYAPGVYRSVCYAYLGTPSGLDHDPAGAMLRSGQFVHAEKDNLTCWSVRSNVGWSLRVTPYYKGVE